MCKSVKMFAVMLLLVVGFGVTDHSSLITDVFAGSKQINFQGKLTDNNGAIVPDGLKAMKFHLYPAIDATTDEWNENVNVYVSSGLFNVTLGKVNSLDGVSFNKQYWLGIDVNSVELLPRQELAASAYALGSLGDFSVAGNLKLSGNYGTSNAPLKLNIAHTGGYLHGYNMTEMHMGEGEGSSLDGKISYFYDSTQRIDIAHGGAIITSFNSDGKVGIGTVWPNSRLQVVETGPNGYSALPGTVASFVRNGSSGNGCRIAVISGNYTGFSAVALGDSDREEAGRVLYDNWDDHMQFDTNGSGKVWIKDNGNVGIGSSNTPYKLSVMGSAGCDGGYWQPSDERLKSNIETVSSGEISIKVAKLNAIKYKLNKEEMKKRKYAAKDIVECEQKIRAEVLIQSSDTAKISKMIEDRKKADEESLKYCDDEQLGVSAQELEVQFPELVRTDSNGYKAVAYDKLSVVLLEAIKEQQKQISDQQRQINELKAVINR